MGFYGNITNTSNTTFQFDRIYPNRLAMDANANNDGIFIGRYVLVEYQEDAAYPNGFKPESAGNGRFYFYSSPNAELTTRIKCLGTKLNIAENLPSEENIEKYPYEDGFYEGEILQYQLFDENGKAILDEKGEPKIEFYKCVSSIRGEDAKFKLETETNTSSQYIQNFAIDEKHYSIPSKGFKGYDSTVWTKVSAEQNGKLITKYVNIADLNSVVPTFDIAADAPTMTPITPHFDADSTNVYYKLHVQPQWGLRVAQTDANKSDIKTQWTKVEYNPSTDVATTKYASGVINDIPVWEGDQNSKLDAAIYFNKEAFEAQVDENQTADKVKKHSDTVSDNVIKVEPTGKSGNTYNTHNGNEGPTTEVQVDTQEITINLPGIGNMMSDAWDIIHGKDRNDYRGDGENSSLQGRLDAFEEIKNNQIPVKREKDGTLVGSMINHATPYVLPEGKDILSEEAIKAIPENIYDGDDPWIATSINTELLVGGQKLNESGEVDGEYDQANNSGISIHHSFHPVLNSKTAHDKNKTSDWYSDESESNEFLQENKLPITNRETKNDDTIKLYTPYVDATGHVVGKNIETVTLPYGYKTIKAATQSTAVTDPSTNTTEVIADSTQDTLQFASSNKWIKMSGTNKGKNINYDTFNIGHEVHDIPDSDNENTDLNDSKKYYSKTDGNTIDIPDWEYDEAGHIKNKHNRKYTLPYGYKKIAAENSDAVTAAPVNTTVEPTADNTQDTLNLTASNKWIKFNTSDSNNNDEIQIGHILNKNTTDANKDFGLSSNMTIAQVDANNNQFNIPVIQFDEAGHISKAETHTVSLPNGFTTYTSTISSVDNADSTVGKVGSFSPDTMTDTITLAEGNQWINIETSEDTFTFKHYVKDFNKTTSSYDFNNSKLPTDQNSFITTDWTKDRAGHLIAGIDTTYTLPNGIKTLSIKNNGKDSVELKTASTKDLTADNLVDIITIDNGNRWLGMVANDKELKLYHNAPNPDSDSGKTTNANNNGAKTITFNSTFEIPQVKYDETGHIFGVSKHTITLDSTENLQLNNYSKGNNSSSISSDEKLNSAFGKLENRLDTLQASATTVGSVAYQIAQIVNENANGSIDTLKEIASWIVNDTSGAAKMANDIATLKGGETQAGSVAKSIKDAIEGLDSSKTADTNKYISGITITNGKIANIAQTTLPIRTVTSGTTNGTILVNGSAINVGGLKSAAYTDSSDYARANVLDTEFTYGSDKKTIQDLMNIVKAQADTIAELTTRIEALEPESETPVEGE